MNIELLDVKLQPTTLSVLIAGLYCIDSVIDPRVIPESLYLELTEKIIPYLRSWSYDILDFEDWVKYNLIIAPKELFTDEDIEDFKTNEIYFEREVGRATLIVTAKMV